MTKYLFHRRARFRRSQSNEPESSTGKGGKVFHFNNQAADATRPGANSEIAATEPFTIPGSISDETFAVAERFGLTTCPPARHDERPPAQPSRNSDAGELPAHSAIRGNRRSSSVLVASNQILGLTTRYV